MSLPKQVRDRWCRFQGELFPELASEVGPLLKNHQRFVTVLEMVRPECFIRNTPNKEGRPEADRVNLARAFLAKAVWDIPTTRALIERLEVDSRLRRLCGWSYTRDLPSESTFSRAFAEFAESDLAGRMHEALINEALGQEIVGHVSRDSTAVPAREKPISKAGTDVKPEKRKRGRPKKGEVREAKTRLERQATGEMTLEQMLDDLPKACDRGTKVNSQGFKTSWIGYKFHIDTSDPGIPISCILSSASLHDSQASIPLAEMTEQRVTYLYECMDSAYDAAQIHDHSIKHGHVSIIDTNPRSDKDLKAALAKERKAANRAGFVHPTAQRYQERTTAERVNARLKDDFGARHLRVRGHQKVYAHLMFGVIALCVDQMMRLLI